MSKLLGLFIVGALLLIGLTFLPVKSTIVRVEDKWWESAYDLSVWKNVFHKKECSSRHYDFFKDKYVTEYYDCSYYQDEWVIEQTLSLTGKEQIAYAPLPEMHCRNQQQYGCQADQNYRVVYKVLLEENNKTKTCTISESQYKSLVWHMEYTVKQNIWNYYQCGSLHE